MGLQSGFKCNGGLNASNFTRQGITDKRSSIGKKNFNISDKRVFIFHRLIVFICCFVA